MIWFLIIGSGLITFAMRFVFLTPAMPRQLPDWAEAAMRLVPVAVLSTIIISEVFISDGTLAPIENNPRIMAAMLAAIIAFWTKSVLLTLAGGLSCLYVLSQVA